MNDFEVRANIKFMVKIEWKGTEIMKALGNVYGINAPKKIAVYKWVQRFREGREELEDDPRIGRRTTSKNQENSQAAQNLIEDARKIIVNEVDKTLDIFLVQLIQFYMRLWDSASFRRDKYQKRYVQIR